MSGRPEHILTRQLRFPGVSTTSLWSTASWPLYSKGVDSKIFNVYVYALVLSFSQTAGQTWNIFSPSWGSSWAPRPQWSSYLDPRYKVKLFVCWMEFTTKFFKFRRVIAGTGDDAEDKSKRWQLTSMVRKIGSKYYCSSNVMEMYKSFLEKWYKMCK